MNGPTRKCRGCDTVFELTSRTRVWCSNKCKKKHKRTGPAGFHECRVCHVTFPIGKGQNNKWLCSEDCRRKQVATTVREFHDRQPEMQAIYRARTKEKRYPDSNMVRFRRNNPAAPTCCEACGETRVLDIAHKPNHVRIGEGRSKLNSQWPAMVWVLCPTCHALIDRMNYEPRELGLAV